MALPALLKTPVDIRNACEPFFPDTRVEVDVSENLSWHITLNLSDRVSPIILSYAIETKTFIKELQTVQKISIIVRSKIHSLNTSAFLTRSLLEGCQEFSRRKLVLIGKSCNQVIGDFLNNPDDPDHRRLIRLMGLAPDQIEANRTDEDLGYFREIAGSLPSMPDRDVQARWRTSLRDYYPNILQILTQEALQRHRNEVNPQAEEYQRVCQELQARVIGQPNAVEAVAQVLVAAQTNSQNRSFLFVGPSGVGKTELAQAIVKFNRIVFLSMEKYSSEHGSITLFGSEASYVGSTDKPFLARQFDRCNAQLSEKNGATEIYSVDNTVVLFDEFEKAHHKVKQSLLRLFEAFECQFTFTDDRKNRTLLYRLKNSFIIATSNLFQEEILRAFQQRRPIEEISELFKTLNTNSPIRDKYSPELLNRAKIIPFGPIERGAQGYQRIVKLRLTDFIEKLKKEFRLFAVEIEGEEAFLETFEHIVYGQGTDIRRIERDFFPRIEKKIIENIGQWGRSEAVKIVLFAHDGRICLKAMAHIEFMGEFEPIPMPNYIQAF